MLIYEKIVYVIYLFISIESISECALCRAIISHIDKLLNDSKVDAEIEEVVKKVCKYLPADKQDEVIFFILLWFYEKKTTWK